MCAYVCTCERESVCVLEREKDRVVHLAWRRIVEGDCLHGIDSYAALKRPHPVLAHNIPGITPAHTRLHNFPVAFANACKMQERR